MQEKFSYILLCYAIDSRRSYEGLDEWIDAIEQNKRGKVTPIALVATKCDIIEKKAVSEDDGYEM